MSDHERRMDHQDGGVTFDAELAERIRRRLGRDDVREVAMFGGRSFMVHEQLAVCAASDGTLLLRCPPEDVDRIVQREGARLAEMRGKPMTRAGYESTSTPSSTTPCCTSGSTPPLLMPSSAPTPRDDRLAERPRTPPSTGMPICWVREQRRGDVRIVPATAMNWSGRRACRCVGVVRTRRCGRGDRAGLAGS